MSRLLFIVADGTVFNIQWMGQDAISLSCHKVNNQTRGLAWKQCPLHVIYGAHGQGAAFNF